MKENIQEQIEKQELKLSPSPEECLSVLDSSEAVECSSGSENLSDKKECVAIFGNQFLVYPEKDVRDFIKKLKEDKEINLNGAVRYLNDKNNPNYWLINLMWKFGRYQKWLEIKKEAGDDLI